MPRLYLQIVLITLFLLQVKSDHEPDDILNIQYTGTYQNKGTSRLFNYLDTTEGNIYFYFLTDLQTKQQGGGVNQVVVQLLNPKYRDQKVVQVVINLTNYDSINHQWLGEDVQMDVYSFYKENSKFKDTCKGNFILKLNNRSENWNAITLSPQVQFKSDGQNLCKFYFSGQGVYQDDKYKVLAYCGFISAVIFIQIGCAYKIMSQLNNNEINPDKLSLMTVSIITIQDFYLTMMHMYFLMTQQHYEYFILPIFLLILLSIVFDMRILLVVWRTKYIHEINNGQLRKKITIFYVQFYIGMFTFLIIMYFFTYYTWPLYLQAALFLPQIIHNVRKGNNPQFLIPYVVGLLGLRVVLPLYYRGCPNNIYIMQPDQSFCIGWVTLFSIQILILFIQKQFGPRFFIPKKLIPGHYQYKFKLQLSQNSEIPECNICIQSIGFQQKQDSITHINTSINDSLIKKKVTVMKTPCNHIFHPECLKHWMDVKLECPSCRLQLPSLL